jgi:hypothetical protein
MSLFGVSHNASLMHFLYTYAPVHHKKISALLKAIQNSVVVGKNTLRTSKLGSDLHADFDRKEITF